MKSTFGFVSTIRKQKEIMKFPQSGFFIMVVGVTMYHLATPYSTHCTELTCNINIDNVYLQSINMVKYSFTHKFQQGMLQHRLNF